MSRITSFSAFFLVAVMLLIATGCSNAKEQPVPSDTTLPSQVSADPPPAETAEGPETTSAPVTTSEPVTAAIPDDKIPEANFSEVFTNNLPGFYNYCPSIAEDDGVRHLYYCTNTVLFNVTDYIGKRTGVKKPDGSYEYGEETIVLSPSSGSWDSRHVCDPSVIKGEFGYMGETYTWLMAYLGCSSSDNQENKVGIALAKSPDGPFVKVGDAPLVDFKKDPSRTAFQWGVGQPSLVSRDKAGEVYLFYTKGTATRTCVMFEIWDLSDCSAPVMKKRGTVSETGLRNLNSGTDFINNADFAYDEANDCFIAISDCHPNPKDSPDFISSHFRVTATRPGSSLATCTWTTLATVGPDLTGTARNHNTGLVRDVYGNLPQRGYITAYYTISVTGSLSLWSYRIYEYSFEY